MRLAAAALLAALSLSACGGSDGPMSVEEAARRASQGTVISVRGTLVVEYGQALLCSGVAGEGEGTKCGSPALTVDGSLDTGGWEGSWPVQWKESVTLRGTVDGGTITLVRS